MAGPESFAVQTKQRGAAGQLPELQQIRTQGTATRPATVAQPGSIAYVGAQVAEETAASAYKRDATARTADWLIKAAGAIIEPKMRQLQSEQVMKGIQEAAAGKSMDEIQDAPPWYTAIFGETDLVTSARAYKAQEAVSNFVTQVQREIPDMGSMDPASARKYMTEKWQQFQTGDPLTDAVANQQFLNAAPGLFEQYQKQNYKNWQMTAATAQQGAMGAIVQGYNTKAQTHARDQTVSMDDVLKSQSEMIQGLAPVQGQSFTSWADNLMSVVQKAAANGEYHSVNAIMKSGLVDNLPVEQQQGLIGFIRAQEGRNQLNVRVQPKYAEQIADLQYQRMTGKLSAADILQRTNDINAQAQAEYGFMNPLIGADEQAAWAGSAVSLLANDANAQRTAMLSEQKRMAQKTADVAAKADAERRELELGARRFTSGGLVPPGESTKPIQAAGMAAFDSAESANPGSGYRSLVSLYSSNNGLVVESLQNRFTAMLNLADKQEWTPEFDQAVMQPFMKMAEQPGGHFAAMKYFGAQNYKKIQNYTAAMQNGVPQPLAYHEAFVEPQRLGATDSLNKKDREALDSNLSDGFFASFFRDTLGESGRKAVMQSAAGHLADLKANARYTDDTERAKQAIGLAMHDGNLAVYGKWAWDRDSTAQPLHEQVGLSSDQLYGVLSSYMGNMQQFKGTNLDNASFVERSAGDGKSDLMAYVPTGDGKWRMAIITAADIQQHAAGIRKEQRAERAQMQDIMHSGKTNGGTIYGQPLKP